MEIKHELLRTLYKLGLSQTGREYHYFYEAVQVGIKDPEILTQPIKTGLCPLLAEKNWVTENIISKALSKAKNLIWENADKEALLSCFGYTPDEGSCPLTNVFIAAVADSVKLKASTTEESDDLDTIIDKYEIQRMLRQIQIRLPLGIPGRLYLCTAIQLVLKDSEYLSDDLYPIVSEIYGRFDELDIKQRMRYAIEM